MTIGFQAEKDGVKWLDSEIEFETQEQAEEYAHREYPGFVHIFRTLEDDATWVNRRNLESRRLGYGTPEEQFKMLVSGGLDALRAHYTYIDSQFPITLEGE